MRTIDILPGRLDLLEIWHHIATDNIKAATRVSEAIDRAIVGLGEMPGKGHRRTDVDDTRYRFWTVYSYVIVYKYDDASLTVARIIHGARDFPQLFPRI